MAVRMPVGPACAAVRAAPVEEMESQEAAGVSGDVLVGGIGRSMSGVV
jgi:hypothetical protein